MTLESGRALSSALSAFQGEMAPETLAGKTLQRLRETAGEPRRILCLGKAAPGLARAAASRWPGAAGLLYGTDPNGPVPGTFKALWGDHPFPSPGNLRRTSEVRRWLRSGEGPLVALVSGGGSALLVAPRAPWDLARKRALTSELWRAGAPIHEVNAVRARLSEVKAGGLLADVRPWPCTTLVWSDVGPRDWRIVSSGPTIPITRGRHAEEILGRYGITLPLELPPPLRAPRPVSGDSTLLLWDAVALRRSLREFLRTRGFIVKEVPVPEGTSAEALAEKLVRKFFQRKVRGRLALVGAGEATVRVAGEAGAGGRCSHLAAAVAYRAIRTRAERAWAFAALASDGVDGRAGSGAWVDSESLPSEASLLKALGGYDTGSLWAEHGSLLPRRPTGNNLRDLWALVEC